MGIARLTSADQAALLGDNAHMIAIANAPRGLGCIRTNLSTVDDTGVAGSRFFAQVLSLARHP
jgi:hypothetical protein